MKPTIFIASAFLVIGAPIWAQENDIFPMPKISHHEAMKEAEWDWRPGDLIFRNGVNDIDEAVKRTFGLDWASVGIIRASSGGPRVVYADQSDGVTEEMLYEHIEGLSSDEYAVYRLRDPGANDDPDDQMGSGPLVRLPLTIAYGAPFDRQFVLGNEVFYNAELAFAGALNAGVVLGSPVRLRELLEEPEDADPELRKLLEEHRYCRYATSFDECWTYDLRNQSIVTTDSLIGSGGLKQVYP